MAAACGGCRSAISVRATQQQNSQDVRTFASLQAAGSFFNVDRSTIKRRLENNKPINGYVLSVVPQQPQQHVAVVEDEYQLVITHDAQASATEFISNHTNGHKMRVSDENPRRVSVFDLIAGMTGCKNPQTAFQRLTAQHEEVISICANLLFPGAGQRPTPVCDAQGAVRIMLLLPGRAASRFRNSTAHLLIRFLGGDETLIQEVKANAAIQQALPTEHPMRVFGEAVEAEQENRYRFGSPNMIGRSLDEFKDSRVVYLVVFTVDGVTYIKFGKSESSLLRMETHLKDYPNAVIYCMMIAYDIKRIEDEYKIRVKYKGKLTDLVVNNQNHTEIIKELTPEEAEALLHTVKTEIDNSEYVRLRLGEQALEMKRLEQTIEAKRIELKMKLLDLPPELIERNMANLLKLMEA